jgi:ferredoxin
MMEMAMLKGPIELCYFSGTGNTALASRAVASALQASGAEVRLRPIEDTDPTSLTNFGTLGIACPAAAFTTYPLVWRFVKNLPKGSGRGVFLIVTMGGMTMGLVGPLRRLLSRKGYKPLGAVRLVMPGNFLLKSRNESAELARVARAMDRAGRFGKTLLEGSASWVRIPGWPDLVAAVIGNDRPFGSMRKKLFLAADGTKCTRCGLCVSRCPVSNIHMAADGPRFADRCELCMRCQSICPVNAILMGGKSYAQYRVKDEGDPSAFRQR